jgi:uncharacterized membrane protein YebE (DUF533 family)
MELLVAALAGLLINAAAGLSKWLKVETKHVVLGTAVAIGLGYTAFTMYLPVELQDNVVAFVMTALSTSWIVWEYVLPLLKPKE